MSTTLTRGVLFARRLPRPNRGRRLPVVAALCMALAAPVGLAAPAVADSPAPLGKPAVPKPVSYKVQPMTSLGAAQARKSAAAQKAVNDAQAARGAADRKHAVWPQGGISSGRIPATGTAKFTAGGLPVTVGAAVRSSATASGQVQVRVLSQQQAAAAGVNGVLLTATASHPGQARLSINYAAFASAYGGGWSGRLRLVSLPACALTTPDEAACRKQTRLASSNSPAAQSVTATVDLADPKDSQGAAGQERAAQPRVFALNAPVGESPTGGGNYAASPLSASSSWQAGSSSGSFTWSYPLPVPPAAAGPAPSPSLAYDSGSTDGETANTNNQGTQIGEGFSLSVSSYVERSYGSCDDDGQDGKNDLCWKYDNASLVLNGNATELVKDDTTGKWRLKNDDASTVTHMTGADNGDQGDPIVNGAGDGAGEYWIVTTGDGTQYYFGLNKLPGAATQRTNSVWTVPVFGDDTGEPGYSSGTAFASRSKVQAWRWNLDYVVDLHGNAMTYQYTPETNYYAQNGASTGTALYTRGGYLNEIRYGWRSDSLFTANAAEEIQFHYDERCTASDCSSLTKATAQNWPDVPFDSICASAASCDATGPTFFTRKRLTSVDTFALHNAVTPAAYTRVDTWAFTQAYPDPGDIGDSSDETLVLTSITHTGNVGGTLPLPPVTFTYKNRVNRVDSPLDDNLPLTKPRMFTITSETGAVTTVNFSNPECTASALPTEDNDTSNCYPVRWHVNGAKEASLDWFHKYRVTSVSVDDPTGHSDSMLTTYSYDEPAWHHDDDPLTPADERTWSDWRGYRTVTSLSGTPGGPQTKTVTAYLQGMDGDQLSNGGKRSVSAAGIGFTGLSVPSVTDSDQLNGFVREQIGYNGSTPLSVTVNDPWSSKTATQHKSYADTEAYFVRTAKTQTSTYLSTGSWRTRSVNTTFDGYGMASQVNDSGQVGLNGDETCTRTWYARNDALGINSLVSRTRVTGHPCSTAETDLNLPADNSTRGDVLSDTAVVYDNTSATAWSPTQTPTAGNKNWTGRPTGYPATATNSERYPTGWQTVTKTTYDVLGRPVTVTDAANSTVSTVYTPATSGPLTKTATTNPKTQTSYSYVDYARGLETMSYDVNSMLTESTYDALGRLTAVWLPNRSRAAQFGANYTFAYHVADDEPSWTSTSTIVSDGVYNTSYTIYDSLLRPLQTQSPSPDGGRLLTDTRYDSRGLVRESFADVYDATTAPSGAYVRADGGHAPKQTDTVYDDAGRATTSTFTVNGIQKWSTTTSYTGDSTATTAPDGGPATRTITDVLGRPTEQRTYAATSPADADYGGGVGAAYTSIKYTYTRDGKPNTITGPDDARWTYGYDLYGRQTSASDTDTGTGTTAGSTTTAYTSLDQVASTTDPRGTKLIHAYDTLGRQTDLWQASQTDANKLSHWAYDSLLKGQLDSSTSYVGGSGTGGKAYTEKITAYDKLNRPTTTELDLPQDDPLVTSHAVAAQLVSQADYNLDGTQHFVTDPAAGGLASEQITTTRNQLGLPVQLSGGGQFYLLDASYNATAQPTLLTLGTSQAEGAKDAFISNTFEAGTDRLTQAKVTDQTHPWPAQSLNYGYDDAGNVTHIFDAADLGGTSAADNQCYSYDGYDRLTEAWTPQSADCATTNRTAQNLGGAAPYWTSYSYTDGGLRKTQTDHTTSGDTLTTYCYAPDKQHRLTAVLLAGATCTGTADAYTYDAAGNTTTRPNGTHPEDLAWTPQGQLDTVTEKTTAGQTTSTTSHVYDANGGLLIRRTSNGETVLYLGDTEVHLSANGTDFWAQRYYDAGGTPIALRTNQNSSQKVLWLTADQHGTSSLALDSDSQTITKRYTTPFGQPRGTGLGTWPDDKGFLGDPTDESSGLAYIGAREYDPATGRFISLDPLLNTTDAQSLNGYAYADNNPATLSDPSGQGVKECMTGALDNCSGGTPTTSSNYHQDQDPGEESQAEKDWVDDHSVSGTDTQTVSGQLAAFGKVTWHAEGGYWNPYTNAFGTNEIVCFGRTACNKANDYLLGHKDDVQGAKNIAATYCVIHIEECERDARNYYADQGTLGEGALMLAGGGEFAEFGELDAATLAAKAGDKAEAEAQAVLKGCRLSFRPDTKVLLADGDTKPIGTVAPGDQVESGNPDTGHSDGARTVTATHINHDRDLVDLTVETSPGHTAVLHTTSKHPFWDDTTHTWIPAGRLILGHSLETASNTHVRLTGRTLLAGAADMYNLTVDQLHTYYVVAGATPVLVHNSSGCPTMSSAIGEDSYLVKAAQQAGKNQKVQADLDSLFQQLSRGNMNPGLGSKSLSGTDVTYARGRNGGRLFFRNVDGGIQIVGKSDKANESKVIARLNQLYGQ